MANSDKEWLSLREAQARIEMEFGNPKIAQAVLRDVIRLGHLRILARQILDSVSGRADIHKAIAFSKRLEDMTSEERKIQITAKFWDRMIRIRKAAVAISCKLATIRITERSIPVGLSNDDNEIRLNQRMILLVDTSVSKIDLEELLTHAQFREYYKAKYINLKPALVDREKPSGISKADVERLCSDLYQLAREGKLRTYVGLESVGDRSSRGHMTGARAIALITEKRCLDSKFRDSPTRETLDRRGNELIAINEAHRPSS